MKRTEIEEIFDGYANGDEPEVLDEWLDDWVHRLCDDEKVFSTLPDPVRHFFAARRVQWQVGNGGFAQAAYNVRYLLADAHACNLITGRPAAASLIAQAIELVQKDEASFESKEIESLFKEFAESKFSELDEHLDSVDWWNVAPRVKYAAQHRDLFLSL